MENVLVLAPHPDDEVIGCGGTIAGQNVNALVIFGTVGGVKQYRGDHKEERDLQTAVDEINAAASVLGFLWRPIDMQTGPATSLDSLTQKYLMDTILGIVQEVVFEDGLLDTVFIPSPAAHQDHRAMYNAGLAVSHVLCYRFGVKRFYCYDSGYYGWNPSDAIHPTVFRKLLQDQVDKKLEAMRCYESQIGRGAIFSPEFILEGLKRNGALVGAEFAEVFSLIREVA